VVQPLDGLAQWLHDQAPARSSWTVTVAGGLRFAFYGRISTPGYQDEKSSRQWQRENTVRLIAGTGMVVRDFFDAGYSRSLAWTHRPAARALLDLAADPDRGFDALVLGEYERGFSGDQLLHLLPHFHRHRVAVWIPEFRGPVDATDPTHRALIRMLGHQAQREVLRARFRTTAAMRVQVRDHGRHIGGRPPYGYRLVDAGPHPNRIHAGTPIRAAAPPPPTGPERCASAKTVSCRRHRRS
jgi:DNA invertase Pin-like site-specific DNA recombinase